MSIGMGLDLLLNVSIGGVPPRVAWESIVLFRGPSLAHPASIPGASHSTIDSHAALCSFRCV